MNEQRFRALLTELVEENPFAVRAVLKILGVEFTSAVPTLAVTCEERPRLLVNLDFVQEHCRTDAHVKALVCHEFLHVLLRHTEKLGPYVPARHLAFDAVINAIVHRELGDEYSSMMASYYAEAKGVQKLLRPMDALEAKWIGARDFHFIPDLPRKAAEAWHGLYVGRLVADDIEELVRDCVADSADGDPSGEAGTASSLSRTGHLLGNHDDLAGGEPLPAPLAQALDRALREMNGSGIWRVPKSRGVAANPYHGIVAAAEDPVARWRRKTLAVLRQHVLPDRRHGAPRPVQVDCRLPVLSPGDRRAFLRAQWSPFLPDSLWTGHHPKREGTAQVYLDVSGSMNAEMPLVIALLAQLARHIRRPFWAFSDVVAPARIEKGRLEADTTGGTSMSCVLEHVLRTRPAAAVVVTDGYIERLDPTLATRARGSTRLHALLTRDGNAAELARARIPYTQLDRLPAGEENP